MIAIKNKKNYTIRVDKKEATRLFQQCISQNNLKNSKKREFIFQVFLQQDRHVTPDDLYKLCREKDPTIGIATVYRTLKLLTHCGIATELLADHGATYYEPQLKDHHEHIVCIQCGAIVEFEHKRLEQIKNEIMLAHGYQPVHHHLELHGICQVCQKKT